MKAKERDKAIFEAGKAYKPNASWADPVTIERRSACYLTINGKRHKIYHDGFMGWNEYTILKYGSHGIFLVAR